MKIQRPDYENCGLNIAASILRHFSVLTPHQTHPLLDKLLLDNYSNIVLMLFDGMGIDVLSHSLPVDSFLLTHIAKELSAVFPSTTTAATTTIESGISPAEHGWIGWSLYFDEIGETVDIFPNLVQKTYNKAASFHVAKRFLPYKSIFDKINSRGTVQASCVSPYGDANINSLDELFDKTLTMCKDEHRRYIYTYWGEPDHCMHDVGCYTNEIKEILADIDFRVSKFCSQLNDDTLVIITADHGLIDCRLHFVCDHPALREMLLRAPSVEPRAAAFHVKENCRNSFPLAFREAFGDNFLLLERDEFLAGRLLGPGRKNKRLNGFIGDYIAIACDTDSILFNHSEHQFKSMHAGLTEQEMRVPLIVGKAANQGK